MTSLRQLKLLGIALLAVVATSAAIAPGAQAGTFTAGAYPATVTGTPAYHSFWIAFHLITCRVSFHGELTAASEELTLTPVFEPMIPGFTHCVTGSGRETHVRANGCDFRVRAIVEIEKDKIAGTTDIVCPEGKAIEYEITGYSPPCIVTVPPQENLTRVLGSNPATAGINLSNNTPNSVGLQINPGGVRYILSGGCPFIGESPNGIYGGGTTLTAKSGGSATSFSVDG